jgi:transcriptional regulator with XRE-family HTH domain
LLEKAGNPCYNAGMENVKQIIAKNLVELRKQNRLTQLELAERLNYSDKAVSRWERGDTLPDIDVLCRICEMYGVTFDYLTHEGTKKEKDVYTKKRENSNKIVITLLAEMVVWFLATLLFVYEKTLNGVNFWQAFVWAVPLSAIVGIVFNAIWGKKKWTLLLVSVLVWSLLAAIFVQALGKGNIWPIFLLGVPAQIAILLWANLGKTPHREQFIGLEEKKRKKAEKAARKAEKKGLAANTAPIEPVPAQGFSEEEQSPRLKHGKTTSRIEAEEYVETDLEEVAMEMAASSDSQSE